MLKVQLVSAPPKVKARLAELSEGMCPPMGILYIASYIKDKIPGIEVNVLDGLLYGYEKSFTWIKEFRPQILGLSFNTLVAESAYALIKEVKKTLPDTMIVVGGPHVTALTQECLMRSEADVAVIGEGEETFLEICRVFKENGSLTYAQLSTIMGIAFEHNGKIIWTEQRPYIENLDSIPFPDRKLVTMSDYRGWYLCKQTPETIMIFSRGCPYRCTFCSNKVWTLSPSVRLRSPKNIVDEMEMLKSEFGVREVFDNADELNNNLTHAKEVCREMIRRNIQVSWKAQLRAHPLDRELVELMSRSGCWYVQLGIESGNEETLRGIRKHITKEQIIQACRLLKEYKIKILGFFMFFNVWEEEGGLKFEDVASCERTLEFAGKLVKQKLLDYIGWAITTPHPGSELYDIALRHRLIKPGLMERWDAWLKEDSFVMQLPGISDKDIAKMKTRGSVLRGLCMLKSGGMRLKDLGYVFKKGLKVLDSEIKGRMRTLWTFR